MRAILKEKVAIVTGASRGIGKETAIKLAQKGYKIVINYYNNKEESLLKKPMKGCLMI